MSRVLQAVARAPEGATRATIAKELDLPTSTVHRMVQSLLSLEFLDVGPNGETVHIGPAIVDAALRGSQPSTLSAALAPYLTQLADRVGESAFVSRFNQNQVELIAVYGPTRADAAYVHPARGPVPLHACSSAKAIFAFRDRAQVQQLLQEIHLEGLTANTVSDLREYFAELDEVRFRGYAECREEITRGVYSIAAPVETRLSDVRLSIGVTTLISRANDLGTDFFAKHVLDMARTLGTVISGYRDGYGLVTESAKSSASDGAVGAE
ncbi:IclR family transcriptional regulator [Aquisalimonas lutea]|uniref:IclR family transcriptional regulator n=1 Tax=Aquisalimonas lutea TaxID=1327750 RepID=UPI0025B5FB96|nr:IclR family transcriptional regulator [Aquisalimonas lutea]MDN3519775.1 IclR family transcriptional regulator [Aquisalimonas lutea]